MKYTHITMTQTSRQIVWLCANHDEDKIVVERAVEGTGTCNDCKNKMQEAGWIDYAEKEEDTQKVESKA